MNVNISDQLIEAVQERERWRTAFQTAKTPKHRRDAEEQLNWWQGKVDTLERIRKDQVGSHPSRPIGITPKTPRLR